MPTLIRAFGIAAVLGGALRAADSFAAQAFSAGTLASLYFVTDVFLLLGIAGVYLSRRATIGIAGTIGCAIFTLGILVVRAAAFGILGANGYQLGAAIALLGLAILSGETLLRRHGGTTSAVLWLVSLALGLVATFGIAPAMFMLAAGVAFGAGFVAAGFETLSA